MNGLQKSLAYVRRKTRYLIDRAFAREFVGQALLMLVLMTIGIAIGMSAVFFGLFSEENATALGIPVDQADSFENALLWSLNQLFRALGFRTIYGSTGVLLIYSLVLSLGGLVLFSLLISMINNSMARRFDALRRGDTPVLERNHVLVLGWNNKIHNVIRQIAELKPGSKVVVLAPVEVDVMREALRVSGVDREKVTLILRTGSISTWSELERVAVTSARNIMILTTDGDDSETIKAMVLLAGGRSWRGGIPAMTAEISEERNFELASIAARNRIHVVSSSTVISKILVQTVRNPGLAAVYAELMSRSGNNINIQAVPELVGEEMELAAHSFSAALPIGVTWSEQTDQGERHAVALNPEPDYDLAEDDQLVLLAASNQSTFVRRQLPETPLQVLDHPEAQVNVPERTLIIGWSGILPDILRELDSHALSGTRVSVLVASEEIRAIAEERLAGLHHDRLAIDVFVGDPTEADSYTSIPPAEYGCVLVLAGDAGTFDADTRTLRTLLRLGELRRYDDKLAHTVVELTDATNRDLLENLGVDDVVVSSDIVSAQLAQVTEEPMLGPIYRELLSAGGIEISIRPISEYASTAEPVPFSELIRKAQERQEVALGVQTGEEIRLNPGYDQTWSFEISDQIVVLAQQVY